MPEFYRWSEKEFQREEKLLDALGLETGNFQMKCPATETTEYGSKMDGKRSCRVISIVGAGGKTSTMFQLAKEYAGMGKRVIVTTSTHIFRPDGYEVVLEAQPEWQNQLMEFAEKPGGNILVTAAEEFDWKKGETDNFPGDKVKKKLKGMEPQKIGKLVEYCDVLLIEADGSRGFPVKVPAEHEPVVIPETQVVIGCVGLTAVGKMIQDVCFRSELLEKIKKDEKLSMLEPVKKPEQLEQVQKGKVTEQLLAEILCSESGTRKNVGKRAYRILLNQLDGSREKSAAERTARWIDQWNKKNKGENAAIAASCYLQRDE